MILLDTCALLRIADGVPLPVGVRSALDGDRWAISALSAWEISIKHALGKLPLDAAPAVWWPGVVASLAITVVPFTDGIAIAAGSLPSLHADPFDRGIIATAQVHGLRLASVDRLIVPYGPACGVEVVGGA